MTNPIDFDPLHSTAPLIVYLDIKSPYAFVAKDPTRAMADQLGIDVDWRPLTLDIPSYLGSARLNKSGKVVESHRTPQQWTSVKYAYKDTRRYAALQGYTLRGTEKIWDTSIVHMGMLWAKQHNEEVLRRFTDNAYERFWRRDLDVEDVAVVSDVLAAAGAEVAGFDAYVADTGRREHDLMQQRVFEAGIFGVPGYVVEEEYFFGREHLPTIRWILTGRRGEQPDIAYQRIADMA